MNGIGHWRWCSQRPKLGEKETGWLVEERKLGKEGRRVDREGWTSGGNRQLRCKKIGAVVGIGQRKVAGRRGKGKERLGGEGCGRWFGEKRGEETWIKK